MKKFIAASIALLFAAACGNVMADSNATGSYGGLINSESVLVGAGPFDHAAGAGDSGNSTAAVAFVGAWTPTRVRFEGTTTSIIGATFLTEADIRVVSPNATLTTWQNSAVGTFTSAPMNAAPTTLTAGSGAAAGNWNLEFIDTFDDGPGADAQSTNVRMILEEFSPSTVVDSNGVFTGPTFGASPGTYNSVGEFAVSFPTGANGNHDRYTFTLGVAGTVDIITTDTLGFVGLNNGDTQVKIFDSLGNTVAGSYDDDSGVGFYSQVLGLALNAGTYTLVVSDFGGNMASSTTLAGTTFGSAPAAGYDYGLTINFVPEPSSLLLVGVAGLFGLRRRRR